MLRVFGSDAWPWGDAAMLPPRPKVEPKTRNTVQIRAPSAPIFGRRFGSWVVPAIGDPQQATPETPKTCCQNLELQGPELPKGPAQDPEFQSDLPHDTERAGTTDSDMEHRVCHTRSSDSLSLSLWASGRSPAPARWASGGLSSPRRFPTHAFQEQGADRQRAEDAGVEGEHVQVRPHQHAELRRVDERVEGLGCVLLGLPNRGRSGESRSPDEGEGSTELLDGLRPTELERESVPPAM